MPDGFAARIKSATNTLAGDLQETLADGTAAATDVVVAGMTVGDELISVIAYATKASIATQTNKTSEYTVQDGGLNKAGGTDETNNQLRILWADLT
jgi:hypothetical protein